MIERLGIHDSKVTNQLTAKIGEVEHFIADKSYNSEAIREQAGATGMNLITPKKLNTVRNDVIQ